jgi:pSer/pThr/pTyr-binding forkhead associated (FHA) protein
MTKNVLTLKHFEQPPEPGVWWRLMCLTGATKGEVFLLKSNRAVLGRGETADIRVMDIKSSREHAEITRVGEEWTLTDLGSQNGVVVNDQKITQVKLKEGDKIVIGQTVFKFSRIESKGKVEKLVTKDFSDDPLPIPQEGKRKNALLWLIIVVAVGVIFLSDDGKRSAVEKPRQSGTPIQDVSDDYMDMVRQKQLQQDKAQKQKLNTIFQRGLREYREKNYFRAIDEFNFALIINPNDPLADFYLRKTKEELDRVIIDYFIKGKRDEESLRLEAAMVSYCAVVRLLQEASNFETDERYKKAVEGITQLEGQLGIEPGEDNCIKKRPTDK